MLSDDEIKKIEDKALEIRRSVIKMLFKAGSGHLGGSLGTADIFATFYFNILKHDPERPLWENRDRLILSNGHVVPARYAAMDLAGYFSIEESKELREFSSVMQGHPERIRMPALETTSGPLGLGLGQAAGIAKAAVMDDKENDFHVFCMLSDGEQDAGNTWEAAMFASANKLSNLTVLIDRNSIQISDHTYNVMPLEPLKDKYEAFGWQTIEINGNNAREIAEAAEEARSALVKPVVIIAHTTAGKGIPWIENDYRWHGGVPESHEQMEDFLEAVESGK